MENYYRVTAYYPQENISFIADSFGKFKKLWQFSAYLKTKGCDIKAVSKQEIMIDGNTQPIAFNKKEFVIRSCAMGTSTWSTLKINGKTYKSIRVGEIEYVPDINETTL